MKVLFIHQSDNGLGGGQIQMFRLLEGLRRRGVEVRVMCRDRTRETSVDMPRRPRMEKWIARVSMRLGLNDVHAVGAFDIPKTEAFAWADVVDVHSLHSNFFSYLALPRITRAKPLVFTLHDMWALTGHCHASLECERWKSGCGQCPHLDVYPPVARDGTAWDWRMKRWAYQRSSFTAVAPSRWLHACTREGLLRDLPCRHIPHGIDTEVYSPLDKAVCRELLGIPPDKRVLLFAVERMDRPLKGADLLIQALRRLGEAARRNTVLLLLGGGGEMVSQTVGMPSVTLGYVTNDRLKRLVFSAADLFLHPTRADNFPLVVLEAMACGTPVVSFRVGGVPELVRNDETGWVAEPEDAEGFGAAVERMLGDARGLRRMSETCRATVEREYRIERQVQAYIDLYEELIRSGAGMSE
ncbi:MAG: glycosyltransferase [Verrucomicrobia bacterium]|nr:MAG: glycosyltransferase [Verrucomicrobiota bacterium]